MTRMRAPQIRGAWLAPRSGFPLDSNEGSRVLQSLRDLGVTHVAVGHDVQMPSVKHPKLTWRHGDAELVGFLRRARRAGLQVFLIPRIESPDFFKPPYPFRGNIRFAGDGDWRRFHDDLEAMILHYGRIAAKEGVAIFGMSLELKHSVRGHPQRWRQIIAALRKVYPGKVTYSANWYQEWEHVQFWDALDFIGVGAYFELKGRASPSRDELVRRWQPIMQKLVAVSERVDRPILFTEVGYTGYRDTAEKPWEWAGKQGKGVPIDFAAQADAWAALLQVVAAEPRHAGLFAWSFYNNPQNIADWEYGIQGRPSEAVIRKGFEQPKVR